MQPKRNCWELKRCGRQPGGLETSHLGVCRASVENRLDGVNGGLNGGRACWALAGTLCDGVVQGTFATKLGSCLKCDFYKAVVHEEGRSIARAREILDKIGEQED